MIPKRIALAPVVCDRFSNSYISTPKGSGFWLHNFYYGRIFSYLNGKKFVTITGLGAEPQEKLLVSLFRLSEGLCLIIKSYSAARRVGNREIG